MKIKNIVKYVFMVAVIIIALQMIGIKIPFIPDFRTITHSSSTLEILQSEPVLLLVTDRISTNVTFVKEQTNFWLGNREILAVIHVRYLFGIDMEKLTADSLEYRGNVLVVHLPEVEILEMAPDLGSLETIQRQSGLRWIESQISGGNEIEELMDNIDSIITEYAYEEDLIPARSEVVSRLDGYMPTISDQIGMDIIFE